jgi:hypothetical protein
MPTQTATQVAMQAAFHILSRAHATAAGHEAVSGAPSFSTSPASSSSAGTPPRQPEPPFAIRHSPSAIPHSTARPLDHSLRHSQLVTRTPAPGQPV